MITKADQIRQAIREAVKGEGGHVRQLACLFCLAAPDTALEKLARLIK